MAATRGGGSAKNPEGFAGWVVLAGIDADDQLRVRYLPSAKEDDGGQ